MNIIRNYKSLSSSQEFQEKNKKINEHAKITFDFSACKFNAFEEYSWLTINKVPILEQNFLTHRRNAGEGIIVGVDIEKT